MIMTSHIANMQLDRNPSRNLAGLSGIYMDKEADVELECKIP